MRPLFSYYGAKWTVAGRLGPPRRDVVVEPFAGSACYSVRWEPEVAHLLDVDDDVCAVWDFLIHASERDVMSLPTRIDSGADLDLLPSGPRQFVGFWIGKGRAEPAKEPSTWYKRYRSSRDCRVWGDAVKHRVASSLHKVRKWTITQADYTAAPDIVAHWHIDPPYSNDAGSRYRHSNIDYGTLAGWCRSRRGFVQVCENTGADWLPFTHVCDVVTARGRRSGAVSSEAVWEVDTLGESPEQR